MTHRLWWRVTDVLPLAEHAASTPEYQPPGPGRRGDLAQSTALHWTRDADRDWLSSSGVPTWYAADGTRHRVRAETWTDTATGATGNPAPNDPADHVLPLQVEHLDGRRTLLDLLRFASTHDVHWLGVDPDRASDTGNTRYVIAQQRGDLLPPAAIWIPATVTSPDVGGGRYQALIADGYTALSGVLARFHRDDLRRLADDLYRLNEGDVTGDVPDLLCYDNSAIMQCRVQDDNDMVCRIEHDRVHADPTGYYAIGAYQWRWTRVG